MSLLFPSHRYHQSFFGPLTVPSYHPVSFPFSHNPFSAFDTTFNELSKWANESHQMLSEMNTNSLGPKFQLSETEDAYHIEAQLPSAKQDDLTVEFANQSIMVIKGRGETVKEEGTKPSALTAPTPVKSVEAAEPSTAPSDDTAQPQATLDQQTQSQTQPEQSQDTDTAPADPEGSNPAETTATEQAQPNSPQKPTQQYWSSSRTISSFQRAFSFTDAVNHDAVKASLKDGVLKIEIPKIKKAEPENKGKKVEIIDAPEE